MTLQSELPPFEWVEETAEETRARRTRRTAALLAAALVVGGTAAGIVHSRHHSPGQHQIVLGAAIQPLPVYRRIMTTDAKTTATTRAWPMAVAHGVPGHWVVTRTTVMTARHPAVSLHVQSATVRPFRQGASIKGWALDLTAPEAPTFNLGSTTGKFFVAVADHQAFNLLFVEGSTDGTDYALDGTSSVLSKSQATAIALSLTTHVVVDSDGGS